MEFSFIEASSFWIDVCNSLSDSRVVATRRALSGRTVEITSSPLMQLIDQSDPNTPRVKFNQDQPRWYVLSWANA